MPSIYESFKRPTLNVQKNSTISSSINDYLNPEYAEPMSIRRFLGNLYQNARELTGTDEESMQQHLEGYNAAKAEIQDMLKQDLTPAQREQVELLAQKWSVNLASNVGAVAPISAAKRAENLAKFMEGSKVQNPVYHGTNKNFDSFSGELSGTKSNTGAPENTFFFSSDPEYAGSYTVKRVSDFMPDEYIDGANIKKSFVSLKKPLVVNAKGENWRDIVFKGQFYDINELAKMAKESGKYDGVIVKNVYDKGIGGVKNKSANTVIAFNPNQIKSATGNRGTFDPNDPNILHGVSVASGLGFGNNKNKDNR